MADIRANKPVKHGFDHQRGGQDPIADLMTLAKSGDTPLTGDVTLSEGANVTLTQVGQNIEIAALIGSPWYFARFTVDANPLAPFWVNPGGRSYRARAFTTASGFTQLTHNDPGLSGYTVTAAPANASAPTLTGTYLITAAITATFPAQQEVREAGLFVTFGGSPEDPLSSGNNVQMFDLSVGSPPGTDADKTFQSSFVVSGTDIPVQILFGEDDINESRTTDLSTAWVLEILALQLV